MLSTCASTIAAVQLTEDEGEGVGVWVGVGLGVDTDRSGAV
jgi:hypothetical protein